MASQALEQMLEFALRSWQKQLYQTTDVYTAGTTALYTPPPKPFNPKPFFPTSTGFGISIPKPLKEIDDYHETFKIDRYDNLYGGHSTITIGGKKIRIDHDK